MRTGHRIGIVAASAAAAMGIMSAAPASAAPTGQAAPGASPAHSVTAQLDVTGLEARKWVKGPRPVSKVLEPVNAGESEWVRVRWKTDRRICDVEVVVWGNRKVDIDYPGDREYTSFSRGDSLGRGSSDFTSFRVEADYDRDAWVKLEATISYTDCSRHSPTFSNDTGLTLPVRS